MEIALILIILLLVLGWVYSINQANKNKSSAELNLMQQSLQQTTQLVLQQLSRQQEATDRSNNLVHNRIENTGKIVSDVQSKLVQLEEANKRIFDLGKDISSLQKILQAPKLRGGLGETWLAEIIAQIIPADRYKMQYTFKTGDTVDAVIFLHDGLILPIDSKFSLENFLKYLERPEEEKIQHKKQFNADIKKRIDEISKKYILPHEGTLEFAFMYVPAENVYYQAFIQDIESGLQQYAFEKKVIPVSPNSFYAYLQVILFGLRGMEVEKNAKDIQKNLAGLQGNFTLFRESYDKVNTHLRHAQQNMDQGEKRLDSIENRFVQISQSNPNLIDEVVPIKNTD